MGVFFAVAFNRVAEHDAGEIPNLGNSPESGLFETFPNPYGNSSTTCLIRGPSTCWSPC